MIFEEMYLKGNGKLMHQHPIATPFSTGWSVCATHPSKSLKSHLEGEIGVHIAICNQRLKTCTIR